MKIRLFTFTVILVSGLASSFNQADAQTDVVAFWHFDDVPPAVAYDFSDEVVAQDDAGESGRFNLAPDLFSTGVGANLEVYLGNAGNLDGNGGGGFLGYTSPVSGDTFDTTRTIRFDDLAGGGDDFDINGNSSFTIDRNDGTGPVDGEDFGNDALLYFTLDGTGFQDFQVRFDAEGTPFDDNPDDPNVPEPTLPDGFDIFYRTTGPDGIWFREADQNNIPLIPNGPETDSENQNLSIDLNEDGIADEYVSLAAALDNQANIEIIINDFDGGDGNGELEIDNIEIVANAIATVPEPSSACLIALGFLGFAGRRRR